MSYLDAYLITCPNCGYKASGDAFEPSLCDECFCPECGCDFIFEDEDDE